MSRRITLALASVPLAIGLLAGCQSEPRDATSTTSPDSPTTAAEARPHVPAGVARQHEVLSDELAEKGQSVTSGDWTVNLITEAAEPWHVVDPQGNSTFREPADGETNHIEIIPVETKSGRIVPDVPITVDVVDADGASVQKLELTFYWATFMHYANNFSIAEPGEYTLKVTIGVPPFPRHGEEDESPALSKPATVEFTGVQLGSE